MKPCKDCGETKRASEFHRRSSAKDKRASVCKQCKAIKDREAKLLALYDLTPEDYQKIYDSQGGHCYLCGNHKGTLHVDHDHSTGYVRGLVCGVCNTGLGHFKDNIHSMLNAVVYLLNPPFHSYLQEEHPEKYKKMQDNPPEIQGG